METPKNVDQSRAIFEKMYSQDHFSQWLGLEMLEISPGTARLQMKVRQNMLNGFGTCQGGVTFAFADSALAFASNSHGKVTVSIDAQISWPVAVKEGDTLTAFAEPLSRGNRISSYNITVSNQDKVVVAHFRGTVYHTSTYHFETKN